MNEKKYTILLHNDGSYSVKKGWAEEQPAPAARPRSRVSRRRSLLRGRLLVSLVALVCMTMAVFTFFGQEKDAAGPVIGNAEQVTVIMVPEAVATHNAQTAIPQSAPVVSFEQLSATVPMNVPMDHASNSGQKTFMDWQTITAPSSKQYAMQQTAWTDPATGIRMYEGRYMVALGTYYAQSAGELFRVTFEGGATLDVVTGDIKDDRHTDTLHQHRNGNIVEFIVEMDSIPELCLKMGDMSYVDPSFMGQVISIEKVR